MKEDKILFKNSLWTWIDRFMWTALCAAILIISRSVATHSYVNEKVYISLSPIKERINTVEFNLKAIKIHTCYTSRIVAKLAKEKPPECLER